MRRNLPSVLLLAAVLFVGGLAPATAGGYGGYGHRGHAHHGGHYGGYYGGSYHHYDDDDDAAVALGVGILFGALLGHAFSQPSERHDYDAPAHYHRPPARVPYAMEPRVVVSRETASLIAPYPEGSCLQAREYQTQVQIQGRAVGAYGIACLQADGSWRRGPARIAPE